MTGIFASAMTSAGRMRDPMLAVVRMKFDFAIIGARWKQRIKVLEIPA